MKLSIRYADKIVGTLIVLALGILIFAIIMLGSSQRWFSRDFDFTSQFHSATGLSPNMPVLYKGFTIGRVKSIRLDEADRVEVHFIIFDTYIDRVRHGSLVELVASPLGALGGNQFLFHPGPATGALLTEGAIPTVNSEEGKKWLAAGIAERPESSDSISNIMNRVDSLLVTLDDALKGGDEKEDTNLGEIVGNVNEIIAGLKPLPDTLNNMIEDLNRQIEPILANIASLSDMVAKPEGSVASILSSEGEVYQELVISLDGLSGIVKSLESIAAFVPTQLPQLTALIIQIRDVMEALENNPLLNRGIPERKETNAGGAYNRDLEF